MTGYYDYVLGLIPATLIGITALLGVFGIPLTLAVPVGGGVSVLVMGHALFVNGPVDDIPRTPVADAPAQSTPAPSAD